MKNKMQEIAKLLGVKVGEKFNIKSENGTSTVVFHLDHLGLNNNCGEWCHYTLNKLLTGEAVIVKIPFKPSVREDYYYISSVGDIHKTYWIGDISDYYCYKAKNCFKTREEITHEDIERIVKEMKGDYHGTK